LATERRNSVYLRGSAQVNLGRLTAYGYFEGGKDLVNQTVFATNTTSSSVLAATLRLTRAMEHPGRSIPKPIDCLAQPGKPFRASQPGRHRESGAEPLQSMELPFQNCPEL